MIEFYEHEVSVINNRFTHRTFALTLLLNLCVDTKCSVVTLIFQKMLQHSDDVFARKGAYDRDTVVTELSKCFFRAIFNVLLRHFWSVISHSQQQVSE